MAVITISRQFGAGGRTLGTMVADKLNYRFLDELIIQELSEKANVSKDWIKSMERSAGGKLSQFISGMLSRDYMERLIGEDKGYIDEVIYVELLKDVLTGFARQDNVVLMGRGGQYILSDFKKAFHILLVADIEDRIKFMQRFYDMSSSKAQQTVTRGQKMRANLYRKFSRDDYNQPNPYHLVLNMSRLSLEKAQEQIIGLATS